MREGERERPLLGGGDRSLQMTQQTFSAINLYCQKIITLPAWRTLVYTHETAQEFAVVTQLHRASHSQLQS